MHLSGTKEGISGVFLLQISGHFHRQEKHMKQEDEAIVYVWLLLQWLLSLVSGRGLCADSTCYGLNVCAPSEFI